MRNIEDYKEVNFDFKNIDLIGPAFADELIRKTNRINNSIIINWVNSNGMINIMLKEHCEILADSSIFKLAIILLVKFGTSGAELYLKPLNQIDKNK